MGEFIIVRCKVSCQSWSMLINSNLYPESRVLQCVYLNIVFTAPRITRDSISEKNFMLILLKVIDTVMKSIL